MESESMVEQEIDLETSDLGHLTFSSLDTHTSATTDGNLLSSLTTEPITDDISTTSVLTILPQVVSNFQRGLTPIEQTHYAVHNIGGNSPLQTTPHTGYELTDLGVAASIDTSCKLVSDSSEILLRSGDSNEAIQCMQTQGDQQSQQSEHITLGSTTWGSENGSLTFTTAEDHHMSNNCSSQAGRHVENFTTEYLSDDQQKLPEFKSAFDCSSQSTEGTYLSTAVKVVTGHLPQQLYQVRNPLMNQQQPNEQQQLPNLVHHNQGFKTTVSQQMQQNIGGTMRQQNSSNVSVTSSHIGQHNGCGGVTQQSLNNTNSNRTFSIRLPISTPLGKGLHLQLVAKGPTPIINNNNNQTSSNFITTNNLTHTNNFVQGINTTSLKNPHTNSIGETVLLVRDKATGKSYIVPAGSTPLISEKNNQTKPLHHPEHQTINIRNNTSPCATPIDVVGNGGDSVYGDLGISEPQPVIDVNEFLNIPPKIIQSEQNTSENNEFLSNVGKNNIVLSSVEQNVVSNVNVATDLSGHTGVHNGSSNEVFSNTSSDITVCNISQDKDGNTIMPEKECKQLNSKKKKVPTATLR